MQIFETKMDNMVKAITIIIHFAIIPIPFYLFFTAGLQTAFVNLVLMGILFGSVYLLRPYQYVLHSDRLVIRKKWMPKTIMFADILSVKDEEYKNFKIKVRLWGSGGMWGWFGIFYSSEYGNINLQCSERDNQILIETRQGKYLVISPIEKKQFLQQMKKMALLKN